MKKAFTLNELLITLAIISLMLVFGIPAFLKFSKNQTLTAASNLVESIFNETQSLSLATQIKSGEMIKSYLFLVDRDNQELKIYEIRQSGTGENAVLDGYEVKKYILANDVKITGISDSAISLGINFDIATRGSINFYLPGTGGINDININGESYFAKGDSSKEEITLTHQKTQKSQKLTIYRETGKIDIE